MPVLPNYTAGQGLEFGRVPNVDIGVGYVERGVQGLAQGVAEAGNAMLAYQDREKQKQAYDTGLSFEKMNQELANQHDEAVRNQAPGAEGLAAAGQVALQKTTLDWLKTVPPALQSEYGQKVSILAEKYHGAYATAEAQGRNAWELETTKTALPTDQNQAVQAFQATGRQDPVDAIVKDRLSLIDKTTLPPAQKLALKTMAEKAIRESVVKTMGEAEAARTLGVPGYETHGAVPDIAPNATTAQREQVAMSYLTGRGYSKAQAAGIVGNLIQESSLNPGSRNAGDGSDGSDSIGIGQWNGSRATALRQFAAAQGKPATDFGVQLAFLDHELSTQYAGTKSKLMQAQTPDDAAGVIVTGYEKPKGSNYGVVAADGWARRRDSARRLAGGDYTPMAQTAANANTAPDPRYAIFTPEERQSMFNSVRSASNQQEAIARGNLEPRLQDAMAALKETGSYGGAPITRQDFDGAYGPAEGGQKYAQFQRVEQIGQKVDAMKLSTDAENMATVNAAKPIDNGPGFAQQQAEYEATGQAQASIAKARKDDPAAWAISVAPALAAGFQDRSPGAFQAALAAMGAFQTKVGIKPGDQQLLPKSVAKSTVDAVKNADAPEAQRISALTSTIFATRDPAQQRAVFQQLVKEGLPDITEGAVEAYSRGDGGAGERLMQAALSDPSKIPGKLVAGGAPVTDAMIQQSIQDNVMAPGKIGDLAYGVSLGSVDNFSRAEHGGGLMLKAVKSRMVQGETLDKAVANVADDMFGKDHNILTGSEDGMSLMLSIPKATDERAFRIGIAGARTQLADLMRQVAKTDQAERTARVLPPLFMATPEPAGLVSSGNIDLTKRPQVKNDDGSVSTVRSMSYGRDDGKEVLIPTVSDDGKILSNQDAIAYWTKKGQNLGVFDTPEQATAYAEKLHTQQDDFYLKGGRSNPGLVAVDNATIDNQIGHVLSGGTWRDYGNGYAFIDPYQNRPVSDAKGNPIVFKLDDLVKAGTRDAGGALAPVAPLPGVVPVPQPASPVRGPQPIPDFTQSVPTPAPALSAAPIKPPPPVETSPQQDIRAQMQGLRTGPDGRKWISNPAYKDDPTLSQWIEAK